MGGGWILSVKIGLASAAAFSSAVALRQAAPPVAAFVAAEGPRLYKSIAAWLAPPYLYFIINGIILSIAATSRFPKSLAAAADDSPPNASPPPPSISLEPDLPAPTECVSKDADLLPELLAPAIGAEEGFVISRSSWSPRRRGSSENLTEKPPVSARLGRRKSIKASPEGKALRVTRPRKHETLESTWRTITDGRPVPLARHLKKADTWDTHVRAAAATTGPTPPPPAMRKSETFAAPPSAAADHPSPAASSGGSSSPAGKIRREASFGQDDLNRRVEAFIKKFNEEMRLQRQESLQQYMDMINRSGN